MQPFSVESALCGRSNRERQSVRGEDWNKGEGRIGCSPWPRFQLLPEVSLHFCLYLPGPPSSLLENHPFPTEAHSYCLMLLMLPAFQRNKTQFLKPLVPQGWGVLGEAPLSPLYCSASTISHHPGMKVGCHLQCLPLSQSQSDARIHGFLLSPSLPVPT